MDFVDLHVWKKNLFIFPEEKNTFKFQLFMIKIILVTYINLGWNICIKSRYNSCSFLSILRLISFHLLHHWKCLQMMWIAKIRLFFCRPSHPKKTSKRNHCVIWEKREELAKKKTEEQVPKKAEEQAKKKQNRLRKRQKKRLRNWWKNRKGNSSNKPRRKHKMKRKGQWIERN